MVGRGLTFSWNARPWIIHWLHCTAAMAPTLLYSALEQIVPSLCMMCICASREWRLREEDAISRGKCNSEAQNWVFNDTLGSILILICTDYEQISSDCMDLEAEKQQKQSLKAQENVHTVAEVVNKQLSHCIQTAAARVGAGTPQNCWDWKSFKRAEKFISLHSFDLGCFNLCQRTI